jgi:hypothetical protein
MVQSLDSEPTFQGDGKSENPRHHAASRLFSIAHKTLPFLKGRLRPLRRRRVRVVDVRIPAVNAARAGKTSSA